VIGLEQSFDSFSDVEDFAFLAGLEGDPLHENGGRNSSRLVSTGYHEQIGWRDGRGCPSLIDFKK
jgi:hypothetical protein